MGLFGLLFGVGKTNISGQTRKFIDEVNAANKIHAPWSPEATIRDSMNGYETGGDKIIEFKKGLQRLGIVTQEFDFNPLHGHLNASNWYFHIDDIGQSLEELRTKGSAQIKDIFGGNTIDRFSYANQYGIQNDYGRIYLRTALVDGRLSLDKMNLKFEFSESQEISFPVLTYNRTDSSWVRKRAIKTVFEEVCKRRKY